MSQNLLKNKQMLRIFLIAFLFYCCVIESIAIK